MLQIVVLGTTYKSYRKSFLMLSLNKEKIELIDVVLFYPLFKNNILTFFVFLFCKNYVRKGKKGKISWGAVIFKKPVHKFL